MPVRINLVINLILTLIFFKMLKESSNNPNKNKFSETSNIEKANMICKDGFCSLPNQKEISKQNINDVSLFDPI